MEKELINSVDSAPKKVRYAMLDELRGFLVLCMVVYHGLLSLYQIFGWELAIALFDFFTPVEPYFAGAFIVLSGTMCGFSRSNIKRGLLCFAFGIAVSVVTIVGSKMGLGNIDIYFGILHLLGFSMFFCGVFNFILKRINKWIGLISSVALFLVTYGIPRGYTDFVDLSGIIPLRWYTNGALFPLGITKDTFFSADYFPILPWFFLFLVGYYLYRFHIIEKLEKITMPSRIPPLAFLGRHALIIYVVHQPLIYLICMPFTF